MSIELNNESGVEVDEAAIQRLAEVHRRHLKELEALG